MSSVHRVDQRTAEVVAPTLLCYVYSDYKRTQLCICELFQEEFNSFTKNAKRIKVLRRNFARKIVMQECSSSELCLGDLPRRVQLGFQVLAV